jgi:predicted dehydrogenase
MSQPPLTRRQFLARGAAAGLALPAIVPAIARGKALPGPNDRITMGFIGAGGRADNHIDTFMHMSDVQIVAVSDVDLGRVQGAKKKVESWYAKRGDAADYKGCEASQDFRKVVDRDDIDAVVIATPDHWHALAAIACLNSGKDVYCEKPLANSIAEGRAIVEAVKANKRILQVGSQERSGPNSRKACELVRNGYLGELKAVRVNLPCDEDHHKRARAFKGIPAAKPVPAGFDYDTWLGHTPLAPYCPERCHFWWRFNLAYGGGEMTDRGAHVLDICQLGAGFDNTGPVSIEGKGVQNADSLYNTFWDYNFTFTYANGLPFIGTTAGPRGLKFEGKDGWIFVAIHGGALSASSPDLLKINLKDTDVHLGRTSSHWRNFIQCVRSRNEPMAPAESGHRTASLCHLANIAMRVGRKLTWDPVKEVIVGDDEANAFVTPSMRAPWHL